MFRCSLSFCLGLASRVYHRFCYAILSHFPSFVDPELSRPSPCLPLTLWLSVYKTRGKYSHGDGALVFFCVSISADMHPGPYSSASFSSTPPCTFRCLPLVSHPVYTSASPLVHSPRRPPFPSESCSSASGGSSCDFPSWSPSCSSGSFLARQPRPSEALSAVAWMQEEVEEDSDRTSLLSNRRARDVENSTREKGSSPKLRMLCFYPASYPSPHALWDVETASGMHVVSIPRRLFMMHTTVLDDSGSANLSGVCICVIADTHQQHWRYLRNAGLCSDEKSVYRQTCAP